MSLPADISYARIHPAIGIARVGNSPNEFFIGPEVRYPIAAPPGFYRDSSGALKRQAARFRIYGYNAANQVVGEITSDDAEITWTVHVANRKAAWYNFELALDLPEAPSCARRNPALTGAAREKLVIDPGPRSICGRSQQGSAYCFDTGSFLGVPVYLGELRTDEAGRLLFLGGRGVAASPFPGNTATGYGNNTGWHDDISDGPVSAVVTSGGTAVPVDPAWVVTGPPDYAPGVVSVQTMYDVIYDACADSWLKPPGTPSFTEDIYPLFRQFSDVQWVNFGFHCQFGWGAAYDFLRPGYLEKLAASGGTYAELRRQLLNIFRNPNDPTPQPMAWPQIYGDDPQLPTAGLLALTKTHYAMLQQWTAGNFQSDWDPTSIAPHAFESIPVAKQPAALDRSALYFCMGGPFHPGGEMPWAMRHPTMYRSAFRIRGRAAGQPEPDYGDLLTPDFIASPTGKSSGGPLYANGPGDLTRWMAVPWQCDTASCRAGYDPAYDPYLPTFWPARVPNHVLTEQNYKKILDPATAPAEREAAFFTRANWYRWLKGGQVQQMNQMVDDFDKLAVIEQREGPHDGSFPAVMFVESLPQFTHDAAAQENLTLAPVSKIRLAGRTRALR